jgi:hypothetical protein
MNNKLFIIIIISCLFSSCGSGMIGLLMTDSNGFKIMDHEIITVQNGCSYVIEVYGYYEPYYECNNDKIEDVFYEDISVEKQCSGWSGPVLLGDTDYPGFIFSLVHDSYLDLVCGE